MRRGMGPCRAQGGLSTDQMGPVSSWKDGSSHQMTTVPLCCAIWCARRWGDTCILTTVVVTRAIIPRHNILTREWSQALTSRKIGSHMVFIGAEWVSPSYECDILSCSCDIQVSKVMGKTTQYCLYPTNVSLQTHILAKSRRILRSGT